MQQTRPLSINISSRPQAKISQYTYVYVAPTSRCGLGLFTARDLHSSDVALRIYEPEYFSAAKPHAQLRLQGYGHADIFQVGPDLFIPPYGGLDDFTNHSCQPNCGLQAGPGGFLMVALRDIAAGEELTYDYSTHQEHPQEDMTCRCGAPNCRGVVRSFSTLPQALRRRYLDLGVVAEFIAESEAEGGVPSVG